MPLLSFLVSIWLLDLTEIIFPMISCHPSVSGHSHNHGHMCAYIIFLFFYSLSVYELRPDSTICLDIGGEREGEIQIVRDCGRVGKERE